MISILEKAAVFLGLHKRTSNGGAGKEIDPKLKESALLDAPEVLRFLNSSSDGISNIEAFARRAREGLNEIASEKSPHWLLQLLHAFHVPFNYLLLTLAFISYLSDDYRAATVISIMVALSGLLRFWQEFRSNTAAEKLRALVRTTATVSRPAIAAENLQESGTPPQSAAHPSATREEVPIRELVPGDVIQLSAGDLIPADVRILSAKDLFVSQSSLTGESLPVEKMDIPRTEAQRAFDASGSLLELSRPSVSWERPSSAGRRARS